MPSISRVPNSRTRSVPTIGHHAPVSRPVVAFATCSRVPQLDDDDRLCLPALRDRGVDVEPAVWDDPTVDWDRYDLVVLRSTWDYPEQAERFLAWAARVPRLANPVGVVAWNIDKRYLGDLSKAGVPVVPTTFTAPGEPPPAPDGEVVVKPTVSNGSRDTARLDDPAAVADLVERIHASGRTAMVQPYLAAVDHAGETAVVFLDGRFSHAARKGPLLARGAGLVEGLYAEETMSARTPSDDELAVAHAALAAVPGGEALLYGRVDLVPDHRGQPVVLEVEVTEPSLFLGIGGATERFADAIARRVRRGVGEPAGV
jgi:glutathione synthase/RimK-type ligase-like ATP-grasp enzyme